MITKLIVVTVCAFCLGAIVGIQTLKSHSKTNSSQRASESVTRVNLAARGFGVDPSAAARARVLERQTLMHDLAVSGSAHAAWQDQALKKYKSMVQATRNLNIVLTPLECYSKGCLTTTTAADMSTYRAAREIFKRELADWMGPKVVTGADEVSASTVTSLVILYAL